MRARCVAQLSSRALAQHARGLGVNSPAPPPKQKSEDILTEDQVLQGTGTLCFLMTHMRGAGEESKSSLLTQSLESRALWGGAALLTAPS